LVSRLLHKFAWTSQGLSEEAREGGEIT
jgi:hypothetical protein